MVQGKMVPVLENRGVAEKSNCATIGVFTWSLPMTAFHSLPSSCVWWGLIVDDQQSPRAASDTFREINLLDLLGGRLRPEHRRHHIRLFIRSVGPLVELLDVSEKEDAFGVRPLAIAAHYAIEVPEDIEFLWPD